MKPRHLISIMLLLSILLSLGLSSVTNAAQPTSFDNTLQTSTPIQSYPNTISTARKEIWNILSSSKAASAAISIMDNGQIIYTEGFGMADREQSIPITKDTLFNIASVSKVYCATAVMVLVDQNKLGLDHKVVEYLPEFTMADERYKDITVRMLLNHSSGLPGSSFANLSGYQIHPTANQELLDELKISHLKHAPGATAVYCDDGWTLAEMVVERVSGKKYIDFLREQVFQPLGLDHTGLSVGEQSGKPIANYYAPDNGKRYPAEAVTVIGAGGLSSTTEELCRFADSFSAQGKTVLSAASLAEMKKAQPPLLVQKLQKDITISYGLGWDMVGGKAFQAQGIHYLGKSGGSSFYSSYLGCIPENRVAVAITVSSPSPDLAFVTQRIAQALLEEKGVMKAETNPVSRPPVAEPIPQELYPAQGVWLGSNGLTKLTIDKNQNTATFSSLQSTSETPQLVLTYNGGYFYKNNGAKLRLLKADGKWYLFNPPYHFVVMQKIEPQEVTVKLKIDINNKTWLRRNIKPYEIASYMSQAILTSNELAALPGYISFDGIKKIEGPDFAGMVATDMMSQTELHLVDQNGETWARLGDRIYSPASSVGKMAAGDNSVAIGAEGYNAWMQLSAGSILSFQKPQDGRVLVYSSDATLLYDSSVDSGAVYASAGSYIELAGYPGEVFTVTAK